MWPSRLEPKLVTVFREKFSLKQLFQELTAGVIVGIVALPLSIALAIASGVKPEQGLYTAIVAGFLISLLSGSRVQIGGPTGAYIVIVYGIVQQYGYDGLAIATLMAGVMLLIMGFAGFGALIKFIPYPVTVGFTSGIALIIFSAQIRDFFGLRMETMPAEFLEKWAAYGEHFGTINYWALLIGVISLLITIYTSRYSRRVPGSLVAIILGTVLVQLFNLPVETIGSRFGEVPHTLPAPRFPEVSWKAMTQLFSPAVTIAMLGAIESLLSAVVADGMTGRRHRSDMELVAQGVANIASPLFGGIPATGAIARTATNIKNGGSTPIAGMVHAATLLLIMLFFGSLASLIPMATLAAILIVVAYNMSELHHFVRLFHSPRSDVAVLLTTFVLTVLVDLTVAIQVGVVLAVFLFMRRMANSTQIGYITQQLLTEQSDESDPAALSKYVVPPDVEVFEIYGPFFFGAADKFKDSLRLVAKTPRVLILRMRFVPVIDATGLRALEDLFEKTRRDGTMLLLSGVTPPLRKLLERSEILSSIGDKNILGNIQAALARANEVLGGTDAQPVAQPVTPAAAPAPEHDLVQPAA